MSVIDMRSDTVTRPSAEMLKTMSGAQVGDDVFGDDPTINSLQEEVAELLGKEAALFVPSGTMGNQLALMSQTRPGDQILLEDGAHIYRYEGGAPGALAGVLPTCIQAEGGQLTWDLLSNQLNPDNVHFAPPSLICLENTHNGAGGRVLAQASVVEVGSRAHDLDMRVHLDGARLWHAHIATGLSLKELTAPVNTVSVCFSKALGAPVGSVLAGDAVTIKKAHRFRKMFGGGMRQAGILAAACQFALANNLERLAEDHEHARLLATGLDHPALKVNHPVETNIVILDVTGLRGDQQLLKHLEAHGVLAVGFGPGRVRLIPNLNTPRRDVLRVVELLNTFAGEVN